MKFHRSYAVTLIAAALVACGGGGGDSTPTPTSFTVTCPDDSKQTATTLDLATSACPAPTLVSITPANNATGIAPESVAIVVATSSVLTTPASGDVTLKAGTSSVPVTVTMVGTKGFKVTPSAKLLYAQAYTFLANVKDSLGKNLTLSGSFTTASVSCTSPLVPDSAGTSCVPPVCTAPAVWSGTSCEVPPTTAWWPPTFVQMGVKVYLNSATAPVGAVTNATYPGQTQSGLLPPECRITGDACWKEAVRNGTIKFFATGAVEALNPGKAIVFGFYKTVSTIGIIGKTVYCNKPFYADDGTYFADAVENHCIQAEEVSFFGNALGGIGLYIENGVDVCYQKIFDQNQNGWIETRVTCP